MKIVCRARKIESSSKIMILVFPSSNMSVAYLDSSGRGPEGGCIKPDQIKLLKYHFSMSGTLLSRVPLCLFRSISISPRIFHVLSAVISAQVRVRWRIR